MAVLEEPIHVYAVGTAGAGKTRFAAGIRSFLRAAGHDAVLVNLDPGAEVLPYDPDVDVRDWVSLADVMETYELGPNGAQIVAADLVALRAPDVAKALETFRTDYVVFDTPGQTELFVFREAGRILLETFGRERATFAFLFDPYLARRPSAFVSELMLAATTSFRFAVPQIHVLSKRDLFTPDEVARLVGWSEDRGALMDALLAERPDLHVQMATELARVLEGLGAGSRLIPVSSDTLEGFEDVLAEAQSVVLGGEDLAKDGDSGA